MAIEKPQTHRPGTFKQTNKQHNHGQHKSKGSINVANKGKVSVKSITKKRKCKLNREQRRHQALQIRQNKREEVLSKKRSLGGFGCAPFLVCIVPLNKDYDPASAVLKLTQCDSDAIVNKSPSGAIHITIPKFKQRFSVVMPQVDNDLAILDTMKVSNTVVFMISADDGINYEAQSIDSWGKRLLLASLGQGIPTPIVAVTELDNIPIKKRNEQKQAIQKQINKWLPDEKVVALEKDIDGINLLRKIGNQKRKPLVFQDKRPHLYAERAVYEKGAEGNDGTLDITGYLRGVPLSVNDLIYIPGLGTYQMSQIDAPADPYRYDKKKNIDGEYIADDGDVSEYAEVLEVEDPNKQESLLSENIPDPPDAKQTWPTEDEPREAEQEQKARKAMKVPRGWSSYQTAWIPDDTELLSDSEDDENYMDAASEDKSDSSDAEDNFDTLTESEIPVNDQQYDEQLDMDAEDSDLEKLKAAKADLLFPDEMDTPQDIPAKIRFQKYRALKSFRTSPWDPKENEPSDYSRIFRFRNFNRTRGHVMKDLEDKDGTLPGLYITLHVKNVPEELWNAFSSTGNPVIVFGLLPHENKMSVVHVLLTNLSDEPLKSKERLVFQCGYRRYIVNPIFSQHTNGKKHKFERFFQPESTCVASFFAPIQFPPSPVLCFKEVDGSLILVATGNVLTCNPDRMIIKRIVLSGHPFKVHKRSAVIRFMFFNREDIAYFKACELRTKYHSRGHIKEPLGTHGHMKCVFNKPLKSQDTVLLNLYKRVFPKFTFEECIVSCPSNQSDNSMDL